MKMTFFLIGGLADLRRVEDNHFGSKRGERFRVASMQRFGV